jgi:hypothetical protein
MADKLITTEHLKLYKELLLPYLSSGNTYIGTETPTEDKYILWIDTSSGKPLLKYKNSLGSWTIVSGGGSTSTNNAEFNVTNKSGWLAKTVAYGAECDILLEWSSIEDGISTGNGTVTISVGGVVKSIYEEEQGGITVNIDNYLLLGDNEVIIAVSDLYGNMREIKFSISCVKVSIDSYFTANTAYTGVIPFVYKPIGAIEKTVHFLVDGKETGTPFVGDGVARKVLYVGKGMYDGCIPASGT